MSHAKLRAIGQALQEEESRFIGYPEIERKSKDLGFGMTVRTLRFYVDEGILPPPRKVGKTPVYEEEWILNVLLTIHLMKTRLNRSLTEVRTILGRLQEDPAHLADKLSALYEEWVKSEALKPLERQALVDACFDLLTGRQGDARQASELRLAELVDVIQKGGRWEGEQYTAPEWDAILRSQGAIAPPAPPPAPAPQPTHASSVPAEPARPTVQAPQREESEPPRPAGAITPERARACEELFVQRFEASLEVLGRVHCPLDGKAYKAGPRERTVLRRDSSGRVVELMKRHRVYDRSLLDVIPLNESREVLVHQRGLFGRGDLRVVVAALCLSPLESFVQTRWARDPLDPLELERALDGLSPKDDVFYYVGLLSTVGWSLEAKEKLPARKNVLTCLVEPVGGSAWRRHRALDPRWAGVERVFDPETDQEKIDRVRGVMEEHLRPKGEFLIIKDLEEDHDVGADVVSAALEELLGKDPQLEITESGGRQIIKRKRL
mgnify:CR=1 FL=1